MLLCSRTPGCRKLEGHRSPCTVPVAPKPAGTAPNVRTAAQAEAERQFIPRDRPTMVTETVAVQSFIDGAVWGAALVTPTREQIAEALWCFPINAITLSELREKAVTGNGDYEETLDYLIQQADAVLALIFGMGDAG